MQLKRKFWSHSTAWITKHSQAVSNTS